jgi:hypothetical protein
LLHMESNVMFVVEIELIGIAGAVQSEKKEVL